MWFVFLDGTNTIRAWGSYWTGLERIYFNDALVVQSLERGEEFEFEINNTQYQIAFCTRSVAIGQIHCTLFKDGHTIQTLHSKRRKVLNIRPIRAHIGTCLFFGLTAGILNLPLWSGFACIMLSFCITLLSNAKKDEFIIEQASPSQALPI